MPSGYLRLPYKDRAKKRITDSARNKRWHLRFRELVDKLKDSPCLDCGVKYPPYVMEFDHRDPSTKRFQISTMYKHKLETLLQEIEKCDLVCSNCHRMRSARRGWPGTGRPYEG